jgi:hypothetical protein
MLDGAAADREVGDPRGPCGDALAERRGKARMSPVGATPILVAMLADVAVARWKIESYDGIAAEAGR